jgi:signal transduction histidine kinase
MSTSAKYTYRIILLFAINMATILPCIAGSYEYSLDNFIEELSIYPNGAGYKDYIRNSLLSAHEYYVGKKSKKKYENLLRSADSISDKNITVLIYARIAGDYADLSDAECFSILEKGFAIARKYNSIEGKLQLLQVKSYIKTKQKLSFSERLFLIEELLQEATKYKNNKSIAIAIKEKVFLFYSYEKLDSSVFYAKIALIKHINYYNTNTIIGLNNVIGLIENKRKNYRNAIEYYNKTIQYAIEKKDTAWIGIASGNKGMSYYYMGMYDSALVNLHADIAYSILGKEYSSAAMAMTAIGSLYINKFNVPDSSEKYFDLAKATSWKGRQDNIIVVYDKIHKEYAAAKKYDLAYKYYQEYIAIKDSLSPILIKEQLKDFQKKFELDKKDNEIVLLEKDNELQKKKTLQIRIIVAALSIILGLLTVILVIVYDIKEKNKENARQIGEQKNVLKKQADELTVLNNIKDKIFSILAHDMRSPIAALKSTFDLLDAQLISEAEFKAMRERISNQLFNLNIVLDNLLLWSKSQIEEGDKKNVAAANITEIIMRNVKLFELPANEKQLNVLFERTNDYFVMADFNQIDIAIRNLLSNAIKFTLSGGSITITAIQKNNTIEIAVTDTGTGISEKLRKNLFTLKNKQSTAGTEGESGTGIGLWLCKSFVEQNQGTLTFKTEMGFGSTFYITLLQANV